MAQTPIKTSSSRARIEISETDESKNIVATYFASPPSKSNSKSEADVISESGNGRIDVVVPKNTNSYARSVLNAFLPAGYPHSVTGDYLE